MSGNDLIKSRADAAVLSHDFALAARLYNTLLKDSPNDVNLLEKLGSIYVKSQNDQKALSFYLKVNELKPNDFSTLNSLGGIYRRLKKYEDSIAVLKKARALNKDIAQVDYNLGFTYKFMEKYDEAVDCFESAIQLNPSDVLAYNHLGAIHQKRGETQQAISTYQKGLKVDRNHPVLHLNLAKSYEKENQIKNAMAEYEAALRSKPGWTDALSDYSKLLIRLNKTKEAKELVRQSLILNPRNYKMYALNGNILVAQCNYPAAVEEYKKSLAFDPVSTRALIGLATALEENGNPAQAVEYIEKVLKLKPQDTDLLKRSASIAIGANRLNSAASKIKLLLDSDSDDVESLDLAGQYYIVKNDSSKSEAFFRRINTLNPDYVKFMYNAAKRYKQIGKITNAEHSLRRYLVNNAEDSKAFTELGIICEELQKTEEALTNYKKAISIDPNNELAHKNLEKLSVFDDTLQDILGQEIIEETENPEIQNEEEVKDTVETVSAESQKEEENESLIDEEASSTDSDLWKSESWNPDEMVDENQDPFAALDGGDESVLTGPASSENKDSDSSEEIPQDIPEEKPDPKFAPLESLADEEPSLSDEQMSEKPSLDKKDSDDLDFEKQPEYEEEPSFDENTDSLPESDLNTEPAFDEASQFEAEPQPSDEPDFSAEPEYNPEPYRPQRQREPYQNIPQYEPPSQTYSEPYRTPVQSGLSDSDNRRLMDSMLKAQDEANRAMSAAEKAWDAATKAADAAQIVSESENVLSDMAQNAVSEAAEKLKIETEEYAKEAAAKAAEAAAEKAAAEAAEKALADKLDMIDSSLEKFEKMLDEKESIPEDSIDELSNALKLFKSLRALGESLPENEKHNFLQSKNRMRMDYVIGKLSGNKGLLTTSQNLRDSGKLATFVREEEVPVSYRGKRLAFDVLQNIKSLTENLNDKDLLIGLEKIISGFKF